VVARRKLLRSATGLDILPAKVSRIAAICSSNCINSAFVAGGSRLQSDGAVPDANQVSYSAGMRDPSPEN